MPPPDESASVPVAPSPPLRDWWLRREPRGTSPADRDYAPAARLPLTDEPLWTQAAHLKVVHATDVPPDPTAENCHEAYARLYGEKLVPRHALVMADFGDAFYMFFAPNRVFVDACDGRALYELDVPGVEAAFVDVGRVTP